MDLEEGVAGEKAVKNISQVLGEMHHKIRECGRNGHPNTIVQDYISEYRIRCFCPDCGSFYNRYTTEAEKIEFERQRDSLSEPTTT